MLKAVPFESLSVITSLRWMKVDWALYPDEWFGLYEVLNKIPLSIAVFVCTFFPILYVFAMLTGGFGKK